MISNFALVLALAVFGASASLVTPGFGTAGLAGGYGGFGTTVADTCRCVKTVVRPHFSTVQPFVGPIVERIPYAVSRTVNTPTFSQAAGVFPTQVTGVLPTTGVCGSGVISGSVGLVSGTGVYGGAGYLNGGLLNTVY